MHAASPQGVGVWGGVGESGDTLLHDISISKKYIEFCVYFAEAGVSQMIMKLCSYPGYFKYNFQF